MRQTRTWVLFILGSFFLAPPAGAQGDAYHILLTNDDGVESPGLQALAERLMTVGEVHVVAPCGERSGSSMAVALRDELTVRTVTTANGRTHRCVDTTPAGTVLLAITALAPPDGFDLVVSGINRGANVGTASHMSGTVGAVMMGALHGVPAVAASFGAPGGDYTYAARFVTAFIREMKRHDPQPGIVFSINIPRASEAETAGVTVAGMGGMHLTLGYQETTNGAGGVRRFRPQIGVATHFPEGSDTAAYMQSAITITPLRFDWTDYASIPLLKDWTLSHQLPR